MADAHSSTLGGVTTCANASQRTVVPCTRLLRMLAFFAAVQRPEAMLSPARCTTASNPSRAGVGILRAAGSQGISADPGRGVDRTNRVTACPPVVRKGTRAEPMSPLAPVTSTRIGHAPLLVMSLYVSALKLLPICHCTVIQEDMHPLGKIDPFLEPACKAWDCIDFVR